MKNERIWKNLTLMTNDGLLINFDEIKRNKSERTDSWVLYKHGVYIGIIVIYKGVKLKAIDIYKADGYKSITYEIVKGGLKNEY